MNGERSLRHDEAELLAAAVRSQIDGLNDLITRAAQSGVRVDVQLFWKEFKKRAPGTEEPEGMIFGGRPDFSSGCVQVSLDRVSRDL